MGNDQVSTNIISSTHGEIQILLLVYIHEEVTEKIISELIDKMNHVNFFICVFNEGQYKKLKIFLNRENKSSKLLEGINSVRDVTTDNTNIFILKPTVGEEWYHLDVWVQDPFLVIEDNSNEKITLLDLHNPSSRNNLLAENLEKTYPNIFRVLRKGDGSNEPRTLPVDGGNILVGEKFVFMGERGYNLMRARLVHNLTKSIPNPTPNQIENAIKEVLGKENSNEIVFITPNINRVNPIWNLNYWNNPQLRGKPSFSVHRREAHIDLFLNILELNDKICVILGKPKYMKWNDTKNCFIEDTAYRNVLIIDDINHIKKFIEKYLNGRFELEIVELDIPVYNHRISNRRIKGYYNNCLIEIIRDKITVWLPEFCISLENDDQNKVTEDKWKNINLHPFSIEVKRIKAPFEEVSDEQGSLRCLTKVLKRKN